MLMNISVTDAALEEAMKAIPPGRRSQFVCDAIRAWIGMTDPDLFDSAVQRGIQYAIEVEGRLADAARRRHCRAAALIESGCDPLEAAARAWAHSRFPGHALTPTGVMAIRCKQFHLPDL